MAWEENSHICLHMQLITILSRIEVYNRTKKRSKLRVEHVKDFLGRLTRSFERLELSTITNYSSALCSSASSFTL